MDSKFSTQPALIELLLRRDPKGCEHLCESYSGVIYGHIIRIVNDAGVAEHLLEKTFKAICANIHQYKQSQLTFLTWVLQLARAEGIKYLCATKAQLTTGGNSQKDNKDETVAINEIAIFNMIQQGYKVYEIAELLGIPVEEVKFNIRKAMKLKVNPGN